MEHLIKEYRAFKVSFKGATSREDSKVLVLDSLTSKIDVLSFPYNAESMIKYVISFLNSNKGVRIKGIVKNIDYFILLSDDFPNNL